MMSNNSAPTNSNNTNTNTNNSNGNGNLNNNSNYSSKQELQFNDTLRVSDAMASNSKELLYAHVYNYLLENKYYETARQFLREADVPITRNLEASNDKNSTSNSNGNCNGNISATKNSDQQGKENEKVKETEAETETDGDRDNQDLRQLLEKLPQNQLLRSKMIINSPDTFLLEWWQLFHLLNDFIESSSNETLSKLDSPDYDYVYPLLPEKHPTYNDTTTNNNNIALNINNVGQPNQTNNNNDNNIYNNNITTTPISNANNNPNQQPLNYIPAQQPYMPNVPRQIGPQNQTSRSNSTQQQPQQINRKQMSSQDMMSPPMYSQQSRLQMYPSQGQPSSSINENSTVNENNSKFNYTIKNNNYHDKNYQTQKRFKYFNNNNDDMNNPVNLLKSLNANGNTINMQDPLMQQQYMTMLKAIMMKQPPYQSTTNNTNNNNNGNNNNNSNTISTPTNSMNTHQNNNSNTRGQNNTNNINNNDFNS